MRISALAASFVKNSSLKSDIDPISLCFRLYGRHLYHRYSRMKHYTNQSNALQSLPHFPFYKQSSLRCRPMLPLCYTPHVFSFGFQLASSYKQLPLCCMPNAFIIINHYHSHAYVYIYSSFTHCRILFPRIPIIASLWFVSLSRAYT